MRTITDRVSYLRGLADGMGLDKEQKENKLILEMISVMDDMAQMITEVDEDVEEVSEFVDELSTDFADLEEILFGDEDDEDGCGCGCGHDHDDDDDEDDEFEVFGDFEEDDELAFDCPHCGQSVMIKAADIDFDESPVCKACGKPFFTDVIDEE